jgi:hypothetical protein
MEPFRWMHEFGFAPEVRVPPWVTQENSEREKDAK